MKKGRKGTNGINRLIITAIILLAFLVLIVAFFNIDGFIPVGDGLEKSDWLVFLGGYLALSATVIVAVIVNMQQIKNERQRQADRAARIEEEAYRLKNENMPSFMVEDVYRGRDDKDPQKHEEFVSDVNSFYEVNGKSTITIQLDNTHASIVEQSGIVGGVIYISYKLVNKGEGTAKDIYVLIEDSEKSLNRHIKCEESFYIMIMTSNDFLQEDQNKVITIMYTNIYGNAYSQNLQVTNRVSDGKYYFNVSNLGCIPKEI